MTKKRGKRIVGNMKGVQQISLALRFSFVPLMNINYFYLNIYSSHPFFPSLENAALIDDELANTKVSKQLMCEPQHYTIYERFQDIEHALGSDELVSLKTPKHSRFLYDNCFFFVIDLWFMAELGRQSSWCSVSVEN